MTSYIDNQSDNIQSENIQLDDPITQPLQPQYPQYPPELRSSNIPILSLSDISNVGSRDNANLGIDVEDVIGPIKPPDGGWGWAVVFGSFVIMFILDGICLSYGLFLQALESTFGDVPKMKMMFGGSLITGCYLIMGPVASALSNEYGFRKLIIVGTGISSLSIFFSSFMQEIDGFILLFGLCGGLGYSLIFLPSSTIIAMWFEKYRATATGIAICGSGLGVTAFSALIPYLIDQYTWRGCLMILAAVNANCLVAGALFRPLKVPTPKVRVTQSCNPINDEAIEKLAVDYALQNVEKGRNLTEDSKNHIFNMVLETKERNRAKSTGSLNDMILTSDSRLVVGSNHNLQVPTTHMSMITDQHEKLLQAQVIQTIVRNYIRRKETKKWPVHRSLFHLPGSSFSHNSSKRNSILYSQNSISNCRHTSSHPHLFQSAVSLRLSADHTNIPLAMARKISEVLSTELSRPIMRPDLYYSGSTQHLDNENIRFPSPNQYAMQSQIMDTATAPKSSPTKEALKRLLDISILKNKTVQLNLLANFFGMAGFLVPYQFLVSYALSLGQDSLMSASLMTILGACSSVGRIATGGIADFKWANCLVIHNVCVIIAGLSTMLLPLLTTYPLMILYVFIYAFSTAAFISLKTIIIVDVMGTEKLTNIFGWTTMAMGIAIIFGPPLLGSFYDLLNSYNFTFFIGGGMLVASGLLSAPLRMLSRQHESSEQNDTKYFMNSDVNLQNGSVTQV